MRMFKTVWWNRSIAANCAPSYQTIIGGWHRLSSVGWDIALRCSEYAGTTFFFFLERATLKKKKKESVRTNIIQPGFRIAEGHKKRREKFAVTKLLMLFTKSLFEIGVTRANGEPIFFLIFLHSRRTHCQCYQTLTNQYSDSQKFFHLRNPTFFFSFPFSSESNKARIASYTKSNPVISSCFD